MRRKKKSPGPAGGLPFFFLRCERRVAPAAARRRPASSSSAAKEGQQEAAGREPAFFLLRNSRSAGGREPGRRRTSSSSTAVAPDGRKPNAGKRRTYSSSSATVASVAVGEGNTPHTPYSSSTTAKTVSGRRIHVPTSTTLRVVETALRSPSSLVPSGLGGQLCHGWLSSLGLQAEWRVCYRTNKAPHREVRGARSSGFQPQDKAEPTTPGLTQRLPRPAREFASGIVIGARAGSSTPLE